MREACHSTAIATALRSSGGLTRRVLMLTLLAQGALALEHSHQAQHAAIMSTRGIQYENPWISDDLVVSGIMIMFLLLFCFGKQ